MFVSLLPHGITCPEARRIHLKYGNRSKVVSGLAPVILLLVCVSGASARPADVRLVSEAGATITFEVTVPAPRIVSAANGEVKVLLEGYGTFSPPGAVLLPGRTFRVAIPAAGEPRVSASVIEIENMGALHLARVPGERLIRGENDMPVTEQYYPSDPWQGAGYPPLVIADAPSFMGRQRVLPIRVNPLRVDANGMSLVRKLSISVAFDRPGSRLAPGGAEAPPVSGAWKRLYDNLLVNPNDVPAFRKPLVAVPARSGPGDAVKRLKIRIPETGLYSLRADSLIAAGLSPGLSSDLSDIALRQYYYDETMPGLVRAVDVPAIIMKGSSTAPTVFEGSDRLVFYAFGIKDDAEALDLDALYTDDNVVWLEEETAGAAMSASQITLPFSAEVVTSFPAVVKSRKDTYYIKNMVPGTFDYYFIEGPAPMESALPFDVHHPSGTGTFSLVVRVQGYDLNGYSHSLSFSIRNSGGTHPLGSGVIVAKDKKTFTFSSGAASWLVDGQNELVITASEDYKYLVNDFTIDYPAQFIARNNMLEFTLPSAIETQTATITGFSVNRGYLIDVTDPRQPLRQELSPSDFTADGGGYRLTISVDASVEHHLFVVGTAAGAAIPLGKISVDTPSQLRETSGAYQVIAVAHHDFMQRFGEYLDRRRAQGYRIITADVEDVYDEFNGGRPGAVAIKRFIKYGVNHWGVEFVVLVGDGNEDHKRIMIGDPPDQRGSPPDFVPSYTYCVNVSGAYDDEVVASDKWYAFVDDQLPVDPGASVSVPVSAGGAVASPSAPLQRAYPDVFIGRIPVGRDIEMRAFLSKVDRFEAVKVDDSWRRRIVLFSDDAWSGRGLDYQYHSYEGEFEWSSDSCRAIIERALPGGFDVQRVFLSHWTDGIHTIGESGPAVYSRSVDSTRKYYTPYLVKQLNRGCLFFTFQGHANRSVMTTESAFASFLQYSDIDSLRTPLPHVFLGIGCHISDFAHTEELTLHYFDGPNGDCFSEQLLFKPGGGAAATYASDGFEYLTQNAELVETIHRSLFTYPPADSVEPRNEYTGAHWVFAEAITQGEIEEIDRNYNGLDQVLRYVILGDPLLRIDAGPPLMRLQADWGQGFEPLAADTLRARNGTNDVTIRFIASDVVAIGKIEFWKDGADSTSALTITRLVDADKTYARSYQADLQYTVSPKDELLAFKVFTPDGREAGVVEIPIVTTIRLFYNNYEIVPPVESPPTGTFRVAVDFPCYLTSPPVLSIDGLAQHDIVFSVTDPQRHPLRWEAVFDRTLPSGTRVFTVTAGDFSRDFVFTVTGNELVANVYCFPNPFRLQTNMIYTLNLPVDAGTIWIYSVSGIRIRTIDIPSGNLDAASDNRRPHAMVWDGRDQAGDKVANGTYLYVVRFERGGQNLEFKGKVVKLE
jgi:hypothetical protein